MLEIPRPFTNEVSNSVKRFENAKSNIDNFENTQISTQVWFEHFVIEHWGIYPKLSSYEQNEILLHIFNLCGVERDFYKNIVSFYADQKLPQEDTKSFKKFLLEKRPSVTTILDWLGDKGAESKDAPNDFTVGFVLESSIGLVVLKLKSNEPDYYSDRVEYKYQIELYTKEQICDINWEVPEYG